MEIKIVVAGSSRKWTPKEREQVRRLRKEQKRIKDALKHRMYLDKQLAQRLEREE